MGKKVLKKREWMRAMYENAHFVKVHKIGTDQDGEDTVQKKEGEGRGGPFSG